MIEERSGDGTLHGVEALAGIDDRPTRSKRTLHDDGGLADRSGRRKFVVLVRESQLSRPCRYQSPLSGPHSPL
ncbi:hypothetical protein [Nocardioides aquiterrae]|uniref:hypothetical protein n=1 Tax=Nocardioides aquiterrae TaxID=203799 RepID=UPI0031D8001E